MATRSSVDGSSPRRPGSPLRPAPGEILVAAVLLVAAFAPLAYLLRKAARDGTVFAGAEGLYPGDQYQYMSWIRDSAGHLLASNLADLAPSQHVFLHPMFVVSGLAVKAGLPIGLAYLAWKPVAVAVAYLGPLAYVRRLLAPGWQRTAGAFLALFYAAPMIFFSGLLEGASFLPLRPAADAGIELYTAGYLSGDFTASIAVGLTPLVFLGLELCVHPDRRRLGRGAAWYAGWTAAAALVIAWLHPWQGVVLLLAMLLLAAWERDRSRAVSLLLPAAGATAPLLYYFALTRLDSAWMISRALNQVEAPSPLAVGLVAFPLVLPALLGLFWRGEGTQERLLRLWLVAVVVAYVLPTPYPSHLLEGTSLPLGVLAVRGVALAMKRLPRGAVIRPAAAVATVLAIAVLTFPGMLTYFNYFRGLDLTNSQPHLLAVGESQALDYLATAPGPGGVLAPSYLAHAVPALTGRPTWVGHRAWTPDYPARGRTAVLLFSGGMTASEALELVRATGARFLLADCLGRADLTADLAPVLVDVRRFGCATVYEVRGP